MSERIRRMLDAEVDSLEDSLEHLTNRAEKVTNHLKMLGKEDYAKAINFALDDFHGEMERLIEKMEDKLDLNINWEL